MFEKIDASALSLYSLLNFFCFVSFILHAFWLQTFTEFSHKDRSIKNSLVQSQHSWVLDASTKTSHKQMERIHFKGAASLEDNSTVGALVSNKSNMSVNANRAPFFNILLISWNILISGVSGTKTRTNKCCWVQMNRPFSSLNVLKEKNVY